MDKIYIQDTNEHGLSFDLKDVLTAIGPSALEAYWTAGAAKAGNDDLLWVTGDSTAATEALAQFGERVSGRHLLEIAQGIRQTIWGEFKGYETRSSTTPWIVIVPFDSTWFEVHSADPAILNALKSKFMRTDPPTWSKAWTFNE